ncbi:putative protein P3 [Fragaria vesca associated virus 1]|nr:putative protein P3 [Fragaria vesca associated virus 1]
MAIQEYSPLSILIVILAIMAALKLIMSTFVLFALVVIYAVTYFFVYVNTNTSYYVTSMLTTRYYNAAATTNERIVYLLVDYAYRDSIDCDVYGHCSGVVNNFTAIYHESYANITPNQFYQYTGQYLRTSEYGSYTITPTHIEIVPFNFVAFNAVVLFIAAMFIYVLYHKITGTCNTQYTAL